MLLLLLLLLLQLFLATHLLELLGDLAQHGVDAGVGLLVEGLLAHGALVEHAGAPVAADAVDAEVVAAGDGHGVGKHVQTDGAVDLLLRQQVSRGSHV